MKSLKFWQIQLVVSDTHDLRRLPSGVLEVVGAYPSVSLRSERPLPDEQTACLLRLSFDRPADARAPADAELELQIAFVDDAGEATRRPLKTRVRLGSREEIPCILPQDCREIRLLIPLSAAPFTLASPCIVHLGPSLRYWYYLGPRLWMAIRRPAWGLRMLWQAFDEKRRTGRTGFSTMIETMPLTAEVSVPGSYAEWIRRHELPLERYPTLQQAQQHWTQRPLVSVLMPTMNTPPIILRKTIESVLKQIYSHWELCIADDASDSPATLALLEDFARRDKRIRLVLRESRGHISAATNSALAIAQGEFVALLDHDDELHPLALHYMVEAINRNPEAALIFSDEDKITVDGVRFDPHFKPQLNYELLLAYNMVSHLTVYRTELARRLGGFVTGLDGAQDYDLVLRAVESLRSAQIVHVPRVLYHWRTLPGSTALGASSKNYAALAGRRAVTEHLVRAGKPARVVAAPSAEVYNRVLFPVPEPRPLVSIVIPTRDRADLLGLCVRSILSRSSYDRYEILIVDNGSREPETFELFESLPKSRVRILHRDTPFNFSALNNFAVGEAKGEVVCLLNNDIEIITPDWLEEMLSFVMQPQIGCVGARLWYPDGRLQHGGVVIGLGGVAGHSHKYISADGLGYFFRAVLHQSFSAVTAACLMIRREVYEAVGGLDEGFAVAFNDVDFCLRVRDKGWRNVWTPYAEMIHHESASRGHEDNPEKQARFRGEIERMKDRWGDSLMQDPAYNPNLTVISEDFALAWPPRL